MVVKFFRANAARLAYVAIGVTVFVAFLIATFPYNDTLTRVLAPMGLRMSSREQGMNFPFGVRMDGVMLDAKDGSGPPFFQSERLRVTPALLSWLMGSPALHINADAYGGNFKLRAQRIGDFTQLRFTGADLHLESYPALSAMGVNLGGILSGDGDASISPDDLMTDRGAVRLSAANATYQIFAGMSPLKLGNLTATVKLDNGKVTIEQVESHGGDVSDLGPRRNRVGSEPARQRSCDQVSIRDHSGGTQAVGLPAQLPAASAELGALLPARHLRVARAILRAVLLDVAAPLEIESCYHRAVAS